MTIFIPRANSSCVHVEHEKARELSCCYSRGLIPCIQGLMLCSGPRTTSVVWLPFNVSCVCAGLFWFPHTPLRHTSSPFPHEWSRYYPCKDNWRFFNLPESGDKCLPHMVLHEGGLLRDQHGKGGKRNAVFVEVSTRPACFSNRCPALIFFEAIRAGRRSFEGHSSHA